MENTLLKVPASITKITTMADRSLRLQIDTQEIAPKDAGTLMMMNDTLGVFVFSPSDIKLEDLTNLPEVKVEKGQKTPSQRLRSRLFVYYTEHLKKDKLYFEDWYSAELNKIGEKYLSVMQ
jgi:hypothetical protein